MSTKIKIKQGDGDEPRDLVQTIVAGQTFPFTATITHQGFKPLVVPSTGINEVIQPGQSVTFKVKNFEQAWVVVTDCAALAKRYASDADDFVVIAVPAVAVAPVEPVEAPVDETPVAETKPAGKAAKAPVAASE